MSNAKVGQKIWVNDDGIREVTCRLVGDNEVAYELNGELHCRSIDEIFESRKAAEYAVSENTVIIFCRECSKNDDGISVYEVNNNPSSQDIQILSLRSRLNPELRYAATTRKFFNENQEALKDEAFFDMCAQSNHIVQI